MTNKTKLTAIYSERRQRDNALRQTLLILFHFSKYCWRVQDYILFVAWLAWQSFNFLAYVTRNMHRWTKTESKWCFDYLYKLPIFYRRIILTPSLNRNSVQPIKIFRSDICFASGCELVYYTPKQSHCSSESRTENKIS